jgi:hypothetical protein
MPEEKPQTPQQPDAGTPSQSGQKPDLQNQKPDPTPSQGDNSKPKGTIYDDLGVDEPGKPGSTSWPSTWREDMVKGIENPKAADALKRYQSPTDLAKALLSAQEKIRSGEYKRVAMPDANDAEAMKAWRSEMGVPEAPDDYDLGTLPGVDMSKLSDADKENLAAVKSTFHGANLTKEQAATVSKTMVELSEKVAAAEAANDAKAVMATEDTLRAEWGSEYRNNLQMNIGFLEQNFGSEMTDAILAARAPDGRKLGAIPEVSKAINALARMTGSDVMFDSDTGGGKSIEARRTEIEKIMQTDMSRYRREGLAEEYGKILETMEKRGKL